MPSGVASRTTALVKRTSPPSARCSPDSASIKVVLPHPDGPTTDTNSPSPTENPMPASTSSAGGPAKLLRSPSTVSNGGDTACGEGDTASCGRDIDGTAE